MPRSPFSRLRLLWLAATIALGSLVLHPGVFVPPAWAAEVEIVVGVRSDPSRISVSHPVAEVNPGEKIKWRTGTFSRDAGVAFIQVILTPVGGFPFSGQFKTGVRGPGDVTIPATPPIEPGAAVAEPNIYAYQVLAYDATRRLIPSAGSGRNFIWVPDRPAHPDRKVRGFFVAGEPNPGQKFPDTFTNTVEHLRDVIHNGTTQFGIDWAARPTVAEAGATARSAEEIATAIGEASKGADDDDVFVFAYAGHGSKSPDGDGDEPGGDSMTATNLPAPSKVICTVAPGHQCDEGIAHRPGQSIRDDEFGFEGAIGKALSKVRGIKVVVIDACFSGGMADGRRDLPIPNSVILMACDTNEFAFMSDFAGGAHTKFTAFLIDGLTRDATERVKAKADSNLPDPDTKVTVLEWFDYADARTTRQKPRLVDSFLPRKANIPGQPITPRPDASSVVIFEYDTNLSRHAHGAAVGDEEPQCACFGESCPREVDEFPHSQAMVQLETPLGVETIILTGPTTVSVDLASLGDPGATGREQVPTEIVQLQLTGTSALLGPITLRLRDRNRSPFAPSTGVIEENVNRTARYLEIPPFVVQGSGRSVFNLFLELEAPAAPVGFQLLHNEDPIVVTATITQKPPPPTIPPSVLVPGTNTYFHQGPTRLFDENRRPVPVLILAAVHTPRPAALCDADGDGDVDVDDIDVIFRARNTPAFRGDPRDADAGGTVTVNDARICSLRCTRHGCARQ